MAHPKIPEAKTDRLEIGDRSYEIQELPYTAVLDVVAEGSDIIKAVVAEAAKSGDITNLEWQLPQRDSNGNPVMRAVYHVNEVTGERTPVIDEASGEPIMEPVKQINIELVMGLLFTAVRQLRSKADFFPKLIDAAVVSDKSESRAAEFVNLTAGTMLKAARKVLTLALGADSTLGEELAAAFRAEKKAAAAQAPGTASSTGSSESPILEPSNSAPPQPPSVSSGAPDQASQSAAASPANAPSSVPGTPPVT